MIIKVATGGDEQNIYFAETLNNISKKHSYVSTGESELTLGHDDSTPIGSNNISFFFEPYQVRQDTWDNAEQYKNNRLTFCWNKIFCEKYGFEYLPHQWWFIAWMRDLYDGNYELQFAEQIEKKHLSCMILSNKNFGPQDQYNLYLKRHEIAKFFDSNKFKFFKSRELKNNFHLYGDWDSYKSLCLGDRKPGYISNTLRDYKFCFCPDSTNRPIYSNGWVTERVFNAFRCLTIPIYLGAENVEEMIPLNCFIHIKYFKNIKEIYEYIKGMKESEYSDYLSSIYNFYKSEECRFLVHPQTLADKLDELL